MNERDLMDHFHGLLNAQKSWKSVRYDAPLQTLWDTKSNHSQIIFEIELRINILKLLLRKINKQLKRTCQTINCTWKGCIGTLLFDWLILSSLSRSIKLGLKNENSSLSSSLSILSLFNFMQKIKKFWRFVLEIFQKWLMFRQNLIFWPPQALDKSFPKHHTYVFGSILSLFNFMQKIKKFWCLILEIFWKRSIFGQNLTFWPLGGLDKSFPKHHICVFWSLLLLSNFMQKIKKFWRLVPEIFWKRSIFGPNLTFWPPAGGSRVFFKNPKTSLFYNHGVVTLQKI